MDRPFGHSRISRSLMSLVDAGFRTMVRMEASAEFYSVPKLWFIGANKDAFSSNTWTSLIQAINAITADENGELPQLHQVQQASMTPHSDMLKTLAMLVASQTRVPVDYLGITLDNPTSAEAMASAERRLTRIADKQNVASGGNSNGPWASPWHCAKARTRYPTPYATCIRYGRPQGKSPTRRAPTRHEDRRQDHRLRRLRCRTRTSRPDPRGNHPPTRRPATAEIGTTHRPAHGQKRGVLGGDGWI